jgi:peptidoglycan/xylan/chitin deacetylase (PgdA/CDA1 family)
LSDARCVLTFHRVVDARERDHDVTWASFARVVDAVHAATRELGLDEGGRLAVLTFDDGTSDHAAAGELLAKRGLPGIFFVSAGKVGRPGYLDDAGVRRLAALGHEIGSHGVGHVRLERLSSAELRRELEASREGLASLTAEEVRYFAPPGGSSHPELAAALERCGYRASRSMRWGIHSSSADRWHVPCAR